MDFSTITVDFASVTAFIASVVAATFVVRVALKGVSMAKSALSKG